MLLKRHLMCTFLPDLLPFLSTCLPSNFPAANHLNQGISPLKINEYIADELMFCTDTIQP